MQNWQCPINLKESNLMVILKSMHVNIWQNYRKNLVFFKLYKVYYKWHLEIWNVYKSWNYQIWVRFQICHLSLLNKASWYVPTTNPSLNSRPVSLFPNSLYFKANFGILLSFILLIQFCLCCSLSFTETVFNSSPVPSFDSLFSLV